LRSLRSTFIKRESKMLRYTWISAASELDNEGSDIHTNLAEIYLLARNGILNPTVKAVVPLEQAASAFPEPLRVGHSSSDEVVVRLVNY
jgi:endonuclease V-like protein UPF0215 family